MCIYINSWLQFSSALPTTGMNRVHAERFLKRLSIRQFLFLPQTEQEPDFILFETIFLNSHIVSFPTFLR